MRVSGFTFLELLLSMSLLIVLSVAAIKLLLLFKQRAHQQQQLAALQDNIRFADYYLAKVVRMAGLNDCAPNAKEALQAYPAKIAADLFHTNIKSHTEVLVVGECQGDDTASTFIKTAYFIAPTTRKNHAGQTIDGLFEKPLTGRRSELLENVNSIELQFSTNKAPFTYIALSAVDDWQQVSRMKLLLQFTLANAAKNHPVIWYFAIRKRVLNADAA